MIEYIKDNLIILITYIFIGIWGTIIIFSTIYLMTGKPLIDRILNHFNKKEERNYNIQMTEKNGEITNSSAIIILKNILREYNCNLSNMEKDAIKKGINSIISMERLDNYINKNNNTDIDIEDYI